jgi:hypothetical protein
MWDKHRIDNYYCYYYYKYWSRPRYRTFLEGKDMLLQAPRSGEVTFIQAGILLIEARETGSSPDLDCHVTRN